MIAQMPKLSRAQFVLELISRQGLVAFHGAGIQGHHH
jgi:hypothetical protein